MGLRSMIAGMLALASVPKTETEIRVSKSFPKGKASKEVRAKRKAAKAARRRNR